MNSESDPVGFHDSEDAFLRLLQRARQGEALARNQLVRQYRGFLLAIANSEMDPKLKTKVAASDIVQLSLLAVHQKLDDFRGESLAEFKGWVRTILRNNVRDSERHYGQTQQRSFDREVQLPDSNHQAQQLADPHLTPQSETLRNELVGEIERCLELLSEPHRQVIRLRNWEELPFADIGSQMNCSADAARKLWFRAFTRLKEIVTRSRPELASHLIPFSQDPTSPEIGD